MVVRCSSSGFPAHIGRNDLPWAPLGQTPSLTYTGENGMHLTSHLVRDVLNHELVWNDVGWQSKQVGDRPCDLV